jgi:hypothetical protein
VIGRGPEWLFEVMSQCGLLSAEWRQEILQLERPRMTPSNLRPPDVEDAISQRLPFLVRRVPLPVRMRIRLSGSEACMYDVHMPDSHMLVLSRTLATPVDTYPGGVCSADSHHLRAAALGAGGGSPAGHAGSSTRTCCRWVGMNGAQLTSVHK